MTIIESDKFKIRLKTITNRIKEDKQGAAVNFVKNLKIHIGNLIDSPYKYKKSFYFDDKNIRDMTYKGVYNRI